MNRDQLLGIGLVIISLLAMVVYGYLVFLTPPDVSILVIKLTVFIAFLAVFGILAWIGYTLATTPPPKPIEEIEKEIEEELKKLEKETSGSSGTQ
ncbi:MAG: transcriptional regulator [Sulfolobales archaeon]|jgi:predicted DNA-binding transcriptional regulator